MDYSIILDFGDEPVTTVDEKLDILRFDYSWAEAVQAEEEEEERKNEIEGMDQMPILEDGTHQYMDEILSGLIAGIKDTAEMQEKRRKKIMGKVHKELMASFAKRDQNLYKEAVATLERQNEIKMLAFLEVQKKTRKETLLHTIFVHLVKKVMRRRNPDIAKMLMNNLRQHNAILAAVHKELIIRVEKKDEMKKIRANILTEMMIRFKRMAEVKKTMEMMKKTRKETLLHAIFVHLVKNVMRRRNPDIAKILMNNLRQHNAILAAVHEELIIRVEKKDEMKKVRANILTEMKLRFKRMAEVKKTRAVIWMEMMREIRNRQQLPHIDQSRTLGYEKVLDHQLEKPDGDDDNDEFVPRKLFLFRGVDSFNISPKYAVEPSTKTEQNLTTVYKDGESPHCFADSASSVDKANDQIKPRRTFMGRVKKFLGMK